MDGFDQGVVVGSNIGKMCGILNFVMDKIKGHFHLHGGITGIVGDILAIQAGNVVGTLAGAIVGATIGGVVSIGYAATVACRDAFEPVVQGAKQSLPRYPN